MSETSTENGGRAEEKTDSQRRETSALETTRGGSSVDRTDGPADVHGSSGVLAELLGRMAAGSEKVKGEREVTADDSEEGGVVIVVQEKSKTARSDVARLETETEIEVRDGETGKVAVGRKSAMPSPVEIWRQAEAESQKALLAIRIGEQRRRSENPRGQSGGESAASPPADAGGQVSRVPETVKWTFSEARRRRQEADDERREIEAQADREPVVSREQRDPPHLAPAEVAKPDVDPVAAVVVPPDQSPNVASAPAVPAGDALNRNDDSQEIGAGAGEMTPVVLSIAEELARAIEKANTPSAANTLRQLRGMSAMLNPFLSQQENPFQSKAGPGFLQAAGMPKPTGVAPASAPLARPMIAPQTLETGRPFGTGKLPPPLPKTAPLSPFVFTVDSAPSVVGTEVKSALPARRPTGVIPGTRALEKHAMGSNWPKVGTPTGTLAATGELFPGALPAGVRICPGEIGFPAVGSGTGKPVTLGVPDNLPGGSPMGGSRIAPLLVVIGMAALVIGATGFALYSQGIFAPRKGKVIPVERVPETAGPPGSELESESESAGEHDPNLPAVGEGEINGGKEWVEEPVPAALPDWTQEPFDSSTIPTETANPEPETALRLFLASPDWQTRLRYSLNPGSVAAEMREYYQSHPGGAIGVTGVTLKVSGTNDGVNVPIHIFEVETVGGPEAFPVSVHELGGGEFRVEWKPFVECQDALLEKFAKAPAPGVGGYYVVLKRAAWTGVEVRSAEPLLAFTAMPPYLGSGNIRVYVEEGSELGAELDAALQWDAGYFRVVELEWARSPEGDDYLRIRRIVAENWSPAG